MPVRGTFDFDPERWMVLRQERAFAAMKVIIDQAVVDAKNFTATRGTGYNGHVGRVDNAVMIDAIVGRVISEGATRVVGEFGFINQQDLYFSLQTITGFKHWISGEFIEPTFALRDALILAVQREIAALKEIF